MSNNFSEGPADDSPDGVESTPNKHQYIAPDKKEANEVGDDYVPVQKYFLNKSFSDSISDIFLHDNDAPEIFVIGE